MEDNPTFVHEAKAFLDSTVFADLFEELRKEAYAQILNSKPGDREDRDAAYYDLRALDRIRAKLQSYPDNHKIAESRKRDATI